MKLSQYMFVSQKSVKPGAMEDLYKACAINQHSAGLFEYGPLATAVLQNIENVIRRELNGIGALEVRLPLLQSEELWTKSDRINKYGKEMFKLLDRHDNTLILSPTAEESAINLMSKYVNSYKQLPMHIYQILEKYRDEIRPRFGTIRARQFTMKDAYSFCATSEDAEKLYVDYYNAYLRIFQMLEIDVVPVEADNGEIGGKFSHEFVAECEFGEEDVFFDGDINNFKEIKNIEDLKNIKSSRTKGENTFKSLELGHIFYLDQHYSKLMEAGVNNKDGVHVPYIMGCYGIGISRILTLLSLKKYWPGSVSPFRVHVVGINMEKAREFYALVRNKSQVIFDDRDVSPGTKFFDADALKIPYRLVIGNNVELYHHGELIDLELISIILD